MGGAGWVEVWVCGFVVGSIENKANSANIELGLRLSLAIIGTSGWRSSGRRSGGRLLADVVATIIISLFSFFSPVFSPFFFLRCDLFS